ncbi:MAG: hypothetical protein WC421_02800 [Elusimicrobiales bacterium]
MAKETMQVRAAKGLKCPMENQPRKYITDSAAVEAPRSAYYLRLIADGSLVRVPAEETK